MEKTKYYGIYTKHNKKIKYYTENLTPGISFFGEKLIKENDKEYRETNIRRSKLFAAVSKHISNLFLKKNNIVLYLGASHGYTPSFISDIVSEGYVFCLDFAPRVVRDLVAVCEKRENMIPILADAKKIDEYIAIPNNAFAESKSFFLTKIGIIGVSAGIKNWVATETKKDKR